MLPEFKNLTEEESNLMLMTPALITLLIAGAEGNVNQKEIDWGAKIAHFRAVMPSIIQNYYQEVDKIFNDSLNQLIKVMPFDTAERSNKISNELQKLGNLWGKLDPDFAKEFYKSLPTLAKQVAQSSGGLWGYGSISPEERRFLALEMIAAPHEEA